MKQYSLKNLVYILPITFLVFSFVFISVDRATEISFAHGENYVKINGVPITIMIADEPDEHWQGLSDRNFLGANNGMLFVFKEKQQRNFVMRRMHFPLDIIFIEDNKVVKVHKRLEPEGEKPLAKYGSARPVNYVLEVNGGFADAYGIDEGDEVEINIPPAGSAGN